MESKRLGQLCLLVYGASFAGILTLLVACQPGERESTESVGGAETRGEVEAAAPPPVDVPVLGERKLQLEDASLALEAGGTKTYQRGLLEVPMNRRTGSPARLEVEFFRFQRSPEADPNTPPIFLLRGGPGYRGLGPSLENPGYFEDRLAPYLAVSDVVIPGQRGFGSSGATPCEPARSLTLAEAIDDEIADQVVNEATTACREKWEQQGHDLPGFNALEAAADVVEIARSLGYDKIQLFGVSFGSHWAMTTLRYYPETVARATLGGLEGPDHTYDMPSGIKAALMRMEASAAADEQLAALLPAEGLLTAYQELIHQADASPRDLEVEDPRDGTKLTVPADGDVLRGLVRGYTGSTAFRHRMGNWPADLLTVLSGDLDAAVSRLAGNLVDTDLMDAAFFQIDCASGISTERGARLRSDPAADLIGESWGFYDLLCAGWDADLGEGFRTAFSSEVPAVLIQGNWDTSTPYENAVELRPFFSNHRFVHVEGGSHGALREAVEEVDGFSEALFHWLASGEAEQIPERVELPAMKWNLPG